MVGIIRHANVVDTDTVLLLQVRASTRDLRDSIDCFLRNDTEDVEVGSFTPEAIVLTNDKPADAVNINLAVKLRVQIGEEGSPWLDRQLRRTGRPTGECLKWRLIEWRCRRW